MRKYILTTLYLGLTCVLSWGQPNITANDEVLPFPTPFDYGANMGYYSPWQDQQLADIARGNEALQVEGVGVNSLRPALFGWFPILPSGISNPDLANMLQVCSRRKPVC